MPDLLETIKKAAVDAVVASNPTSVVFGTVTATAPLRINLEQKLVLGTGQLIGTARVASEGLLNGDKVILIRMQGGQQYVVLDKVVNL